MYIIETTRLGLRQWKDSDLPVFVEMNKDPAVMEYFPGILSGEETEDMVRRINAQIINKGFGLWAVDLKATSEFIGFVGLSVPRFEAEFTPCVEIGWRLASRHWGNGYTTEAALQCLEYGFNKLDLREIVSFTSILNTRSINVMRKIGMGFAKEFDHPLVEDGSPLKRHVLYVKRRDWEGEDET